MKRCQSSIRRTAIAALSAVMLGLAGCGSSGASDPFATGEPRDSAHASIIVGSANFAESEILANLYAQALNDQGIAASVKANIGSREVYLDALADGSIDLIAEYSGNLLQFYDETSTASAPEDVYAALTGVLPDGFAAFDMARAQDADAFYVTRQTAERYGLVTIGDLAAVGDDLRVAAPPEFSKRAYGIEGLRSKYALSVSLVPINDGGGQSTVQALLDGQVQFARLDSTSPLVAANDLVQLEDDRQMILAQNIVPVAAASRVSDEARSVIDEVQAALTTDDLMAMNARSVNDRLSAASIAQEWLARH